MGLIFFLPTGRVSYSVLASRQVRVFSSLIVECVQAGLYWVCLRGRSNISSAFCSNLTTKLQKISLYVLYFNDCFISFYSSSLNFCYCCHNFIIWYALLNLLTKHLLDIILLLIWNVIKSLNGTRQVFCLLIHNFLS